MKEEEEEEKDQSQLQWNQGGFRGIGGDDGGGEAVSCVRWRSIRSKPEEGQRTKEEGGGEGEGGRRQRR